MFALLLLLLADTVASPPDDVRDDFDLAPFYAKHIDVEGLPVVASTKVEDAALLEAAYLIREMVGHRPEILRAMAKRNTRFVVMAHDEMTTDVPEHADLAPKSYWDRRARGLGATDQRPAVSCGAENLLGYPGDPYRAENILIHEFAHAIHQMGMPEIDPAFDAVLEETYDAAMEAGLWDTKYASKNHHEYWAEGVQSWFGTNREDDHDHNHVDTRDELIEYDPALAALCKQVFGESDWMYVHPHDRPADGAGTAHLETHDREAAPTFVWPKRRAGDTDD